MVTRSTFFYALIGFLSALVIDTKAATNWIGPAHYTLALKKDLTNNLGQLDREVEGYLDLQLEHDTPCDISMHVLRADGELLVGPNNTKLTTNYKLTGAALTAPDAAWVDSTTFRSKVYHVHTSGPITDTLTLHVQGTLPAGANPPPGSYTTYFAMTVTW